MSLLKLNSDTILAIRRELYKRDFHEFRKKLAKMRNLEFKEGWWQRLLSDELMAFYEDFMAGKRPKLMIKSPPQHGKSQIVIDFLLWVIGRNPRLKTIFASYAEDLGKRANSEIQKMMLHPEWNNIFPEAQMGQDEEKRKVHKWRAKRNSSLIQFENFGGEFRNVTTGGPVTGLSLDIGVIDDVLKGRAEANSDSVRKSKWEWFVNDFFTRFSDMAAMLIIGTNWHVDDPMQRMIEKFPDMKVIDFPAIAIKDEEHRKAGDALFPEHKSLEFLLERKSLMESAEWESLYQQNPIISGGNKFKERMFDFIEMPEDFDYTFTVTDSSYVEKDSADYSVSGHFGVKDNEIYLNDLWREQIDAADIEVPLTSFIKKHESYSYRKTLIEPKGHGIYLNQKFKKLGLGIPDDETVKLFFKDRRMGKVERANNAIPHLSDKKLHININLAEDIKDAIKTELLTFPSGKNDDIVDVIVDAIKEAYSSEVTIWDILNKEEHG